MRFILAFLLSSACFASTGCSITHSIAFDEIGYTIPATPRSAPIKVLIDPPTMEHRVPVRSGMTGLAHKWNAETGTMLRQIVEVEFPQMFEEWEVVSERVEAPFGGLTVALSIPEYSFADFHATLAMRAIAWSPEQDEPLFDATYSGQGSSQGKKMFWAGATGMKSAMRQSSLDAFRQAFAQLRKDLGTALGGGDWGAGGPPSPHSADAAP